jgi:hypothetical protein
MKNCLAFIVTVIGLNGFALTSYAANNSCSSYQSAVNYAARQVQQAQLQVSSAENRLYATESQVQARTAQYSFLVDQARANAQAIGTVGTTNSAACFVRNIFWGGRGGACAFSVANAVAIRARANAMVNTAIARYNSYVSYSQQLIRRTALLVVQAQGRLTQAESNLRSAEAAYQQCLQSNTTV